MAGQDKIAQETGDAPLSEAQKLTILQAWEQIDTEEFNEPPAEASRLLDMSSSTPVSQLNVGGIMCSGRERMSLGNSIETDSETHEGDATRLDGFYASDHTRPDQATAQQQRQKAILSSKAWFYPELPWGAPPSWDEGQTRRRCLPHRGGKNFLMQWELLTCFACFYVGLKVPYVIGYDSVKLSENRMFQECSLKEFAENTGPFSFSAAVTVVDLVLDIMFLVDIAINFLSARWVLSNSGRDFWILVDDMSDIRKLYMWDGLFPSFWIDLLGHVLFKLISRSFFSNITHRGTSDLFAFYFFGAS
jgi:hypothetical protein